MRFYFFPVCLAIIILTLIEMKNVYLCSKLKASFLFDKKADIKLSLDWPQDSRILNELPNEALNLTKNLSTEALYFLVENMIAESRKGQITRLYHDKFYAVE